MSEPQPAGDGGAYDNGTTLSVDDPASQPYVVGVGGTHLYFNPDRTYSRESAWNVSNTVSGGAGGDARLYPPTFFCSLRMAAKVLVKHLSPRDQQAGGIAWCDRFGADRFSPVTTTSITVMNCSPAQYASAVDITRAAAEFKQYAKQARGSTWEVAC